MSRVRAFSSGAPLNLVVITDGGTIGTCCELLNNVISQFVSGSVISTKWRRTKGINTFYVDVNSVHYQQV